MLGWFADSFRFAGALLYWNARKSWFRLRRGRAACPCQSPSDSGRALETGCDACMHWHNQERFRKVCPLLVQTPNGLKCSVNTADVRPFWGIALKYYGGALLAIYLAGVIAVFSFLRTIGYPISILHVGLPPLWHRVGQARGWFFLTRAQQAFNAGKTNEGLLYLANAYEFDPNNYDAGLLLAKTYQLSQPARSDEILAKLLRDHPAHRDATAQQWFRSLLARGEFEQISSLAVGEIMHNSAFANVWMRALVFASRQSHDEAQLRTLLHSDVPSAQIWRNVIETELLLRSGKRDDARRRVEQAWPANTPPFGWLYRVETELAIGDPTTALDLLVQQRAKLDDEAYFTQRLHCLAVAGAEQTLRAEFESTLLVPPLNQPRLKMMCAQLIRHPDRLLFSRLVAKVDRAAMPLTDETAGGWFSLLCTAGVVGDMAQLHTYTLRLRQATETPFTALLMVESYFRGELSDKRAVSFLPYLPVPLEVSYALIERYPATQGGIMLSPSRK